MSTPLHIVKLSVAGGLAALALGYGGAVALDGIGMTSSRPAQVVEPGATPIVRLTIEPSPPRPGEFAPVEPPTRSAAIDGASSEPAPETELTTGSLGEPDAVQATTVPAGNNAIAATPVEPPPPAADPLGFGAGLSKATTFSPPPSEFATLTPPASGPAQTIPERQPAAAADPLQNVELLDPAPPKPREVHDLPDQTPAERVIDLNGSGKKASNEAVEGSGAKPGATKSESSKKEAAAKDAKPSKKTKADKADQKPTKAAKAQKRRKQDQGSDMVSDALSMLGF